LPGRFGIDEEPDGSPQEFDDGVQNASTLPRSGGIDSCAKNPSAEILPFEQDAVRLI